jgi:hypothetical protein
MFGSQHVLMKLKKNCDVMKSKEEEEEKKKYKCLLLER